MSSEQTPPPVGKSQTSRTSAWLLGAFGAFGLIGFIVAFGLVLARTVPSPQAAALLSVPPPAVGQPGPRGETGPAGPSGPRGPAGPSGVRLVRADCPGGNCTLECDAEEILLVAHCGAGRGQAALQSERSAICRAASRTRTEMVAACAKAQ